MLQVREPNEQKVGDLKTQKKLLHETFQVVLAAKLTRMSVSKRYLE
jgi:hypothetical protein